MGLWHYPIVLGLILMTACASLTVSPSGFLSDYQRLKPDQTEKGIFWWERPGVDWTKYTRLMIDPIEVKIDPAKSVVELSKEESNKMAASLRQAVVEAMKDRYPLAKAPRADVLRIRAALTHLKPVEPAGNVVSTVFIGVPLDVGEASIEVQFIDSQTNQVLSELVALKKGSSWDFHNVWSRWTQVDVAFKEWAKKLRAAMDEVQKSRK